MQRPSLLFCGQVFEEKTFWVGSIKVLYYPKIYIFIQNYHLKHFSVLSATEPLKTDGLTCA